MTQDNLIEQILSGLPEDDIPADIRSTLGEVFSEIAEVAQDFKDREEEEELIPLPEYIGEILHDLSEAIEMLSERLVSRTTHETLGLMQAKVAELLDLHVQLTKEK